MKFRLATKISPGPSFWPLRSKLARLVFKEGNKAIAKNRPSELFVFGVFQTMYPGRGLNGPMKKKFVSPLQSGNKRLVMLYIISGGRIRYSTSHRS